jgi:hypothetical protein
MSHFPSAPPPGAYVPPNQSTPPAQGFNPPKPQYGYQQAQASSSYGTPTQNHGPSSVSASNKPANAFGQAFDQAVKQGKPMFNKLGKTISSKLGNKPLTSTPQHLQSYDSFQQHNQPPAYQAQTQHTGQQAQQQNAYHSPQQSPFPQSNYVTPNSGHLGQNNYFDQQTPASPNPLPQANAGYNSNAFGQSGDAGGHLQGHYNQGQPQSPYQQSQAGPHSGQQTGVIGGSQAPPQFVNPPSPHIHNAPSTQPSTQTTNQQQWSPPSLPQHPGQVSSPVTQQQSFSTAPPPPNQSQPQQWIQHHQESSNPTPPPHQSQPQQQWTQHQQQSSNLAPTPPPPPPTQSQQQWTPHHQGSSNPTPPPHQHNAPPPVPLHPNQQQQQTWPQISPAINSPVSPPVSHALPQPSTVYQQPSANAPNEAHKPSQPSTPAPLAGQPQAAPTEFYAELPADLGNLSLDNSKPQSPSDAAASSPYHAYRPAGSDTQSPRPGFTVPRRAVSTSSLHLADPWRFADAVTELPTREFFIIANLLYEALDRKFEPNGTGLLEASKMLESWKVLGFAEEAAREFISDAS